MAFASVNSIKRGLCSKQLCPRAAQKRTVVNKVVQEKKSARSLVVRLLAIQQTAPNQGADELLKGFDIRKCSCRGQVRPDGVMREDHGVTDQDDVCCALLGRKPLALVYALTPQMIQLINATPHSHYLTGPLGTRAATLVYLEDRVYYAYLASKVLHLLGAWCNYEEGCPVPDEALENIEPLTELQCHVALGYLLGYPYIDLRGMHRAQSMLDEVEFRDDIFEADFEEVRGWMSLDREDDFHEWAANNCWSSATRERLRSSQMRGISTIPTLYPQLSALEDEIWAYMGNTLHQ